MAFVLPLCAASGNSLKTRQASFQVCHTTLSSNGITPRVRMNLDNSEVSDRRSFLKQTIAVLVGAAAGTALLPSQSEASVFHIVGTRPANLGMQGGDRYLNLCPDVPNCVSTSSSAYSQQYIPPWTYNPESSKSKKDMQTAVKDLIDVLNTTEPEKVTIVSQRPTKSMVGDGFYIAAEFETPLMGFIDDVEFFFTPDGQTVEYRSASRLGRDDSKANRNRIKKLRLALEAKGWKSVGFN